MHIDRNVVSDRAVGSVLIVVSTPILQLFAGICKTHALVRVQTLRSQLAVERLDEPIVRGLARPREVQRDVIGISPEAEVAGDKFAAVIDSYRLGIADPPADPFARLHDIFASVGKARISAGKAGGGACRI